MWISETMHTKHIWCYFIFSLFLPSTNDINLIVVRTYGCRFKELFKWITTRQLKWELQPARVFTLTGMVRHASDNAELGAHVSSWQKRCIFDKWSGAGAVDAVDAVYGQHIAHASRPRPGGRPRTMLARPCLRYCPTMREMLWQTMTAARAAWYRRPPAIYDILLRDLMTLNVSPLCLRRPSPRLVRIRFRCLK